MAPSTLNLCLVMERWGPTGGTGRYADALARWLLERGHRVSVCCARVEGPLAPGLELHQLPVRGRGYRRARRFDQRLAELLPGPWDVVQGLGRSAHHQVFRSGGSAHLAWVRLRHPGPVGWLWRNSSPAIREEIAMDRRACQLARVVVANSELARTQLMSAYDLDANKVVVVRNGVDLQRFRRRDGADWRGRWGVPPGGRVALFLGHAYRRKGLRTAAAAFTRVAGPRDRLVVAGRQALSGRYLWPLAASLGSRLIVMGAVSEPELLLPGADATLLPTRFDSAANTTLEALACGVPPVTSGMDGAAEIVPDRRLVVANPHDVEGFARALRYAWSADHSVVCRRAAEAWPVSRNGEAMERIYQELVYG